MHRRQLLQLLDHHRTRFLDEAGFLGRARRLVHAHPDIFHRDQWPAHVTGSAWVVNPARDRVILLHHRKHDRWFQPGGHADGDADVVRVALRETHEETGIAPDAIRLLSPALFDLDIHSLPERPGCPRHDHVDLRFLVEIDDHLPLPGSDEAHEVRWVALHDVPRYNNNRSTYRMVEKTRRLRGRFAV